LIWKVLSFPRFKLMALPTPVEEAGVLSKELGINLFIKRDDVIELALGGNKVRKLEFLVGDALAKGCDTLITRGAFHSNHARLTAAAARKAGLDAYLILAPPGTPELQGNVLLNALLGAKVVLAKDKEEAIKLMDELASKLREEGRRPYVIPGGGASPIGVLGYAAATLEILQQLSERGVKPDYVVLATGSGGTQAGLVLGLKLLGAEDVKVVGISIGPSTREAQEKIAGLVSSCAELLKVDVRVEPEEIIVIDKYLGGGYGAINKDVVEVMKYVARREALILDPVYTAKAMQGLIDLARKGYFKKGSNVVFIHTGGTPIIFQLNELRKYLTD